MDIVWCYIGLCIGIQENGSDLKITYLLGQTGFTAATYNPSCTDRIFRKNSAPQCTDNCCRNSGRGGRKAWSCTRDCCSSLSSVEFCDSASTRDGASFSSCGAACNHASFLPQGCQPLLFAQNDTPIIKILATVHHLALLIFSPVDKFLLALSVRWRSNCWETLCAVLGTSFHRNQSIRCDRWHPFGLTD